jgi:hypothetical protein
MNPTPQQNAALKAVCDAVIEGVKAAGPFGAPAGVLYAALLSQGCTLPQFENLMGALVRIGMISQRGQLYFQVTSDEIKPITVQPPARSLPVG